jgi:hypothetical protein
VVAELLRAAADGVAGLVGLDLDGLGHGGLRVVIDEVERLARRVGWVQVAVLGAVDRSGLYAVDGHASAKVMIRHQCQLPAAEASGRDRVRRALADLPEVSAAYRDGEIGSDQVCLIGRVHANRRVRDALPARDAELVGEARRCPYRTFELKLRTWERLVDADGTCDTNERNHERRDVKLVQNLFDLSWELSGRFGALQGAELRDIFDRYLQGEWETDWDHARTANGESATVEDLPRSDAQRRADALHRIFSDAAASRPGAAAPEAVHHVVWEAETYFAALDLLDPTTHDRANTGFDHTTYRCETIDGTPLEPVEAAAASLTASIRRVLVDTAGVVIDLGRRARLFTGSARTAVKLQATHCIWPGCLTPVTRCEIDHLHPHSQGGATDQANGAPLCGRHNRWKQKGYTTWRDPTGTWHTHRPNGTEIT